MCENCFNCYNHSNCAFMVDVDEWGWCENWKPATVPVRAIEHLEAEFRANAERLLQHVYNEYQAKKIKEYLQLRAESLSAVLLYSASHEMPNGAYVNSGCHKDYYNKRR